MIDLRPILFVLGILLVTLAVAMVAPALADAMSGNPDWQVFATSAALTLFVGVTLMLSNRARVRRLTLRQTFVLATMIWVVLTGFAAVPFAVADLGLSLTDAVFEAISGVTTTGSTVIVGLDSAPDGILLWRAVLQWLGGIGILVMAVAVMPLLSVGGMQLFRVEAFETPEKVLPRTAEISAGITFIYVGLTALWSIALWLAGMSGFDAASHAMTTIATGGFSTRDASVGAFDSRLIEVIIVLGMLVGSLPFVLYLQTVRGNLGALMRDSQVRWFLGIALGSAFAVAVWQWAKSDAPLDKALVASAFNSISIMTGTGYTSGDFQAWGAMPTIVIFFLMFVGGCAGSTACGIKVFRFQILYYSAVAQVHGMIRPHGVFVAKFNRRPVPDAVTSAVMGFFFLFMTTFTLLALALGALGLDFMTAIGAAATAICNVGPALGEIAGPSGNFAALPDAAKWLLAAGMLLGRLELFTVLVLFSRTFWRG